MSLDAVYIRFSKNDNWSSPTEEPVLDLAVRSCDMVVSSESCDRQGERDW